ncbi:DUF4345 domain-containing protein [Flammeovirga sp. MY04]|uniref:DUF4345 domain-containing protein n=1 Tax=Flammeovirga sp. MY04 TaxID=1191459 RepID=UPI00080627A5|nr:DUF4345 domain-containing protein [Flammeovirga sp. MY04]ANQ49088.1 DUF4345 domain-containing protein [Flammeovirga sp. MY04]
MNIKKIYLLFFATTLSVIAFMYGLFPNWFISNFLIVPENVSTDAAHILRAVTGLYLALVGWVYYSAISNRFVNETIFITGLFCAGLGVGRLFSIIIDGIPSPLLVIYVLMEFAIVPLVYFLLKDTKKTVLQSA